ncbi:MULTISPECIES: competence/damage-inducible protein A [Halorhodospira]|uniref:competence/damage-inducible protein A n=1 Tax=Halorhodospira TaxID=85108 RepID=UPI001912D3EA|nr:MULTISPECIES: molybdopterin-binding protein [Halorhodospira]MBK5942587.1 competence/damage-inducible protein A [Halorhodospira halophila]MCG5529013.1 competence/damage-inducible protein A [Halorhodospira halophila]MCG5533067.1 competence/damage-inducible protein A [Halorhodospira sp. 9621]MCG5538218.1 competence/damage-inducible protein A [Halorhodospira sp. 9622]MCG5540310.1 competence/damage-inducible protein A [Halorhodospira sp. M39old]
MTEHADHTPRFGALIIGDELLTGRRRDRHMEAVIERLDARGLELAWARLIGDDPQLLTRTLGETFAGGDIVFSFGGIGATPDDRTRQCCAEAVGRPLERHPEAEAAMREQFGAETTEQRLRMVEFPAGAWMIPNPVNRVAGFSWGDHHFVPGFPRMAWPMVEWVLDTHYAHLQAPGRTLQRAVRVPGAREGAMIPLLERFTAAYPDLRISCLPGGGRERGFEVELGVRGPAPRATEALEALTRELEAAGYGWEPVADATPGAGNGPTP